MKKRLIALFIGAITLTACQSQNTAEITPTADNAAPGAYMVVYSKNYDAKDLGPYAQALPPIYKKYGGRYVAFAPNYVTLEGEPDAQAIIISAWPNVDAAKAFWASPEYTEAKKLREGIGEFEVVILPALAN